MQSRIMYLLERYNVEQGMDGSLIILSYYYLSLVDLD